MVPVTGNESEWTAAVQSDGLTVKYFVVATNIITTVCGAGLNVSVLVASCNRRRQQYEIEACHRAIAHLCVASLLIAVISLPINTIWQLTFEWKAGSVGCKLFMSARALGFYMASFSVTYLSICRCAVISPIPRVITHSSGAVVGLLWMAALLASAMQALAFHFVEFADSEIRQCVLINESESDVLFQKLYTVAHCVLCYILPALTIALTQTVLYRKLHLSQSHGVPSPRLASAALESPCTSDCRRKKNGKSDEVYQMQEIIPLSLPYSVVTTNNKDNKKTEVPSAASALASASASASDSDSDSDSDSASPSVSASADVEATSSSRRVHFSSTTEMKVKADRSTSLTGLRTRMSDARRATLKASVLTMFAYAICWTPLYVSNIWTWFSSESAASMHPLVHAGLNACAQLNCVVNPIIYGLVTRAIRLQLRRARSTLAAFCRYIWPLTVGLIAIPACFSITLAIGLSNLSANYTDVKIRSMV